VKTLKVFHRAGQTFITFREIGAAPPEEITWGEVRGKLAESETSYRIYTHDEPITSTNLQRAKRLAEVRPFSGYNLNGRNVEYLIAQAMMQPDEMGELTRNYNGLIYSWHMDHPRMDRYPVGRFVIDEHAGPLPPGTGLFVAHPREPGKRYYAVTSCQAGSENTKDFSTGNSLSKPVAETVGTGEPVCQGMGLWGPYFDYPGERKVYVQWCGPPLAPTSMYFNWSVLVPPDCPERAPVELYFHSGNYSYAKPGRKLLAHSIQIAPHDFPASGWYGYNDAFGTSKPLAAGTVSAHTQRRIVAFLEWAKQKFAIDPDRIIAVGGDGAAMLAVNYPDIFAYVVILEFEDKGGVLDSEAAEKYAPAWGPRSPDIQDDKGRGEWAWADLDKLVLEKRAEDLPLFVCKGGSWGKVEGWGMGRGRFYSAMHQANQPLYAHWAWGGTLAAPDKYTGLWEGLDITRHTPVPAFANSSADAEGEGKGHTNTIYRWKDVKDSSDAFEITITGQESTFDLTPRRLQQFKVRPGEKLKWEVVYPSEQTLQPITGTVTVDENGLVTLRGLKLPGQRAELRLKITRVK
jgi:hypothetical protein